MSKVGANRLPLPANQGKSIENIVLANAKNARNSHNHNRRSTANM